jgi:clan AA aspartic protease (TIGR02281 family)
MPRRARRRAPERGLIGLAAALLVAGGLLLGNSAVAGEWARGPRRGQVPLERTPMGVWIVEATLDGRVHGRFLLDTGATWCALTSRTAARLRLAQVGEQVEMQTAGGLVPMPIVRIGSVVVGGHRARRVQAVILPHDVGRDLDGVIGMNFLNQFTYAIDPRRAVLRLE